MTDDLRQEIMDTLDDPKDLMEPSIEYIHSGNYALNYLLSGRFINGGWPVGSVCEAYGDPSTGKSLVLIQAGARAQQAGGILFLDDTEDAHKEPNMERLGVSLDPTEFRRIRPPSPTIHDCFVNAARTTRAVGFKVPYCYIIDSLSVIASKWSMKEGEYKEDQGRKAKEIRGGLDYLWNAIHETEDKTGKQNSGIYLISRHSIQNPQLYGTKSAKGGNAPAYYSTIRLRMVKPQPWPKARPRGVWINLQIIKSRIAYGNEGISGLFFVDWKEGVHPTAGVLHLLADLGCAKKGERGTFKVPGFDKDLNMASLGNAEIWEKLRAYLIQIDENEPQALSEEIK